MPDSANRRFTDQAGNVKTVIAKGTRIEGEITGKVSMELSGSVKGTARIDGLFWVREDGRFDGDIHAESVVVEGKVNGKINATQKVELRSTCRSSGSVVAASVAIADGSFFEGNIEMRGGSGGGKSTNFGEKRQS